MYGTGSNDTALVIVMHNNTPIGVNLVNSEIDKQAGYLSMYKRIKSSQDFIILFCFPTQPVLSYLSQTIPEKNPRDYSSSPLYAKVSSR